MSQTYKKSFLVLISLIFLLPIFFVPGGALNMAVSKPLFLVFGIVLALLVFLSETWKEGKFSFFFHPIALSILLLPLIYLVSGLSSSPSSLSLLGYNFEVGTFGYVLLGALLIVLLSSVLRDTSRILQALVAFFVSIVVVALFTTIKIFANGDVLVFGNFVGNMSNPIGNWTDLAVSFGFLSVFSALAIGVIPMKLSARILVYVAFVLGTVLLLLTNFSIATALTLGGSILLILYFWKLEKRFPENNPVQGAKSKNFFTRAYFLPVVLGLISVVLLVNPNVSASNVKLSDAIANKFDVHNIDVRPSLTVTLGISKAVLSQQSLLGSGPNTFERDWLIHKPVDINATPFWASSFPFGVGFIPTQVASTGVFGSILWLVFFVILIILGIKVLNRLPESKADRFVLVSTFLGSLFLWASSFLYAPSATVLMFAFLFSGLFISASMQSGIVSSRTINLKEVPRNRFASIVFLSAFAVGALYLGWAGFEKGASAFYFKKALDLSNAGGSLVDMETNVNKALSFAPNDSHYVALSRINFAKAQAAANATTGTPEENQAIFEDAVRKSIDAAKSAVTVNSGGYQNWVSLGLVYSALVPEPISLSGAYENASFAFTEAGKKNPLNPEIPLLLAQLEINNEDREAAISFVRNAIALKEDYADAHLMLAQLEIQEGDVGAAIESAERLASLVPNNPGIYFELGVLKYSNKDYLGATETFRQALALSPDYANAQYYLGVTEARLGHLDKALEQFEALFVTNPNNEEVLRVLEDLRVGKDSFLKNSPI